MSTFHGLEMAKQALFAQQSALYTTGHNIANANTDGYTRQRVNFETMSPYPSASRNRPQIPGQMGTGVQIGAVERIRNKFLDEQFRAENSRMSYWEAKSSALSRMEELINEPSDSGLSKTMDLFWQSLQDLAGNPEKSGARSVVAERGKAVTDTFNYLANSLESIRTDLKSEIDATVEDANSLLRQINRINEQIKTIEPHGYLANDLYDDRDRLIDELSEIINIKVDYHKSEGGALDIADGIVSIELVDKTGQSIDPPIKLIDENIDYDDDHFKELITINESDGAIESLAIKTVGNDDYIIAASTLIDDSIGSLTGLIEAYGYRSNDEVFGEYPHMMEQLDLMAYEFATAFNEQHRKGIDLNGDQGGDFFDITESSKGAASSITVRDDILKQPSLIAASSGELIDDEEGVGYSGNGKNALQLSDVFDDPIDELDDKSVRDFLGSLISQLGINAQEANRMSSNTSVLRSQVEEQRMSVSSVSLDEEMANMIKFQHAYNAAARSMTAIDEMIDRIINGMGLVGR